MGRKLTPAKVARAKPAARAYSIGDGRGSRGLFLRVLPSGTRNWWQAVNFAGRQISVGLGGYPAVSLDEARDLAYANYLDVRKGVDPRRNRRPATRRLCGRVSAGQATLAQCLDAVIALRRPHWKNPRVSERHWRGSVAHAGDLLARPVAGITAQDALAIVVPLTASHPSVAANIRSRLGEACRWAVVQGLRAGNPFDEIKVLMPRPGGGGHRRALPWRDVPDAIEAFASLGGSWAVKGLAMQFAVLCAARPAEAFGATWDEVDFGAKAWRIPARRMKAGQQHQVPLGGAALAVLAEAEGHRRNGLVFPAPRGGTMDSTRAGETMRRAGIEGADAHGFRSSFADWAAESAGAPDDLIDRCLAHARRSQVTASYIRTSQYGLRVPLMESWGAFCAGG